MMELLTGPWPWYVTGPLIGLVVPMLLLAGGKQFGVSENLRHMCAAAVPTKAEFFNYDWRGGIWNMTMIVGVLVGGAIAALFLSSGDPIALSDAAIADMSALGITEFNGLAPDSIFTLEGLSTVNGLIMIVGGGFLVGFGSRYAGGCTSGHAISGLSDLQLPSLIAVIGFFAGGLIATFFVLPWLL
ncbi:MAG: YeeE/YedE family protein [Rhodothermales bacterium]|nr:YeeE/YedE family protein [Rhodothermales bacterium]